MVRALHAHLHSRCCDWALTHRERWCVGSASASSSLTGLLIPLLGSEFLPALEEGNFWIRASHAADHVA